MTFNPTLGRTLLTVALLVAGPVLGDGLPPVERTFPDGSTLRLYGQISKGVLSYDDGIDSETYGLIDNNNSNTRFGLLYIRPLGGWTFENVNEFAYDPYSTADINILQQTPDAEDWTFTNDNIRKLDFTFDHDRYGKVWIGQGSMATDGVTEIDLSGTDVIAYSSVGDSAAAQIIRFSDPALSFDDSLSGIEIGDAYANYDGDRRVRVRYDTPALGGFTMAASFGRNLLSDDTEIRDENLFDAAVNYSGDFDAIEFQAGLGYYWQEDHATIWGGSASAIHKPTGVNLTVSAASQDLGGANGNYWYGKLGLLRDYIDWGATGASIDYYSGDDIFVDTERGITSSTSDSWGLALVQNVDRVNTELWLTYRVYDYADDAASYDDGRAIFGGAQFQF